MLSQSVQYSHLKEVLYTSTDRLLGGGDSPLSGESGRFPLFRMVTGCNDKQCQMVFLVNDTSLFL